MRRRKPCLLRRFLLLGWNVLFTVRPACVGRQIVRSRARSDS